jgi:hypothetical protein
MSNINQLRSAISDQLARLNSPNMTPEKLELEIKKSKAIAELGAVMVDTAKVEVDFIRVTKGTQSEFFEDNENKTLPEVSSNIVIPIETAKK